MNDPKLEERECVVCGDKFTPSRYWQIVCKKKECKAKRRKWNIKKWKDLHRVKLNKYQREYRKA